MPNDAEVIQDFLKPAVAVVNFGDFKEAVGLRTIVENIGAQCILFTADSQTSLLNALSLGPDAPEIMILCGHGDDNGLVLGEFADFVASDLLVQGSLPALAIAQRANLPGKTVINTACDSGTSDFVNAFRQSGAAAYLGPNDSPSGANAFLFVHLLLHLLLEDKLALDAAVTKATELKPAFEMFQLNIFS